MIQIPQELKLDESDINIVACQNCIFLIPLFQFQLQGNKMDSHNLATLFGPNLLHKAKSPSEKEFQVETMERAEERKEVIGVIQEMIEQTGRIFQVIICEFNIQIDVCLDELT